MSGATILVMLWTADEQEPCVLSARKFTTEEAFKVWLSETATKYSRSNIAVNWTSTLVRDDRLVGILEEVIGAVPPASDPVRGS